MRPLLAKASTSFGTKVQQAVTECKAHQASRVTVRARPLPYFMDFATLRGCIRFPGTAL